MKPAFLRAGGAVLMVLGLASCMAPAPWVDAHLGEAVTDMRNAQVLNPTAGQRTTVPAGIDGNAARDAYENYQKSFKAPEKNNNSFSIGVGR